MWHTYTKEGFSFGKIQGCFLSNEFVDALPVHRLKVKNKILKEIYVSYNSANFCETEDEVSTHELKEYLETLQIYLKERCEVFAHTKLSRPEIVNGKKAKEAMAA